MSYWNDSKGFKMTKPTQKPPVASHGSRIGRDEFLHLVADYCISNNCSVDRALADFAIDSFNDEDFKIFLSGSIYTGFSGNPQNYMLQKIVKVDWGTNARMLTGTMVHLARDVSVKYKMVHGELPSILYGVGAMKEELLKEFSFLRPEDKEATTKFDIFKTACKLFRVYYKQVLPHDQSIESESEMSVSIPLEMFNSVINARKFVLTGIADSVYEKEGEIGIGDLKTSANPISGTTEKSEKLIAYENELDSLNVYIVECEKKIKKFLNAEDKLFEAKSRLAEVEAKLADALSNGKATVALEKRIIKWEDEVSKWSKNFEVFQKAETHKNILLEQVAELEEIMGPLVEIYNQEKADADIEACIKAHEAQLAHYALCYMIQNQKPVKWLKVELVVNRVNPYTQVFEWELTDEVLEEAEERIQNIIHLIELALDGVDPMLLFRANPTSYIGSDVEEFKDEVKKVIKSVR